MSLTPDSNDQEILDRTFQDEEFIWVTLEDGHQLKAKKPIKFIDWCQAVRDNVQARIERAEAERRAQRGREALGDPESRGAIPVPEVPRGVPEDPGTFAKKQSDFWLEQLHSLKEQAEELSERLEEANKAYTKWQRVVEVLNEQHSSGDSDTDHGPGDPPVRSGVRSNGNQKGSKRSKQGAVHGLPGDPGEGGAGDPVQEDD